MITMVIAPNNKSIAYSSGYCHIVLVSTFEDDVSKSDSTSQI